MLCWSIVPPGGIELTAGQVPYTVLPVSGLQQLDALPAHCSTGGIELTAGQVPYTVLPGLQQLYALLAHCSTSGIELT
jgi:hypothetical protein